MVKIKRAYESPKKSDGYRILVDRLWPRGVSKAKLHLDEWAKELAPTSGLRKWFGHDPARWDDFRTQYLEELRDVSARKKLTSIVDLAKTKTVTLVYGAHDEAHNNAVVLKTLIQNKLKTSQKAA